MTTTMLSKHMMSDLFHKSTHYHRRKLRELFRTHYNPFKTDSVWTKDLSTQVINDLKLHLSWDLGLRVFNMSRESIGTRIIYRFKELGIFLFMKKIIIDDHNK